MPPRRQSGADPARSRITLFVRAEVAAARRAVRSRARIGNDVHERFDTTGRFSRVRSNAAVLLVRLALACVVIASIPAPSLAQEQATESSAEDPSEAEVELAPIVVDAERQERAALVERSFETPEDVAGFGETIFAEPTFRSFETTAELLGESVGAQIRRQGGRDDFSSLSIRGAPSAQLRILLDGVALGRASESVVNLSDLPMDMVERIEVYRGFSPVSLSPFSSAGVVNVVTRDPETATTTAAIGGGSFGSLKMNGGGAAPMLGGAAAAFASYRHSDGDYDFVFDRGDDNPVDQKRRERRNNDSDTVESLVRWRGVVLDAAKLQVRNHVLYKDEGVPADLSDQTSRTRLTTIREIAAASVGSPNDRWSTEQIVTWEQKKLTDTTAFDQFDNRSDTTASTTIGRWSQPFGKSHWLSGGAEFNWEDFDQAFETSTDRPQADRSTLGIAVGDDWTIAPIDTTVTMQLRHQQVWNNSNSSVARDGNDHSTDPRVGVKWEPVAGLAIKSNTSTYFRPPNFNELYGADGFTVGNPGLVPETGLTWDAGAEWTVERRPYGRLAAGYAYFGSDIDDIIVVERNFRREARAENVSKAEIRGHELRLDWKGPAGLALSANYTHQQATNRSGRPFLDGKDLPSIPQDEGWARLSWENRYFVVAYDLDVSGSTYFDSENTPTRKRPTRTVHGLSLVLGPYWSGMRITLEANNLSDSLVPDIYQYPLPGRSFYATLSWSAPSEGDPHAD